jgi:hypothetical protein
LGLDTRRAWISGRSNLEHAQALTQLINAAVANDRRLEENAAPAADGGAQPADDQ